MRWVGRWSTVGNTRPSWPARTRCSPGTGTVRSCAVPCGHVRTFTQVWLFQACIIASVAFSGIVLGGGCAPELSAADDQRLSPRPCETSIASDSGSVMARLPACNTGVPTLTRSGTHEAVLAPLLGGGGLFWVGANICIVPVWTSNIILLGASFWGTTMGNCGA